jgi:hypothetical protein
VVSVPRALVPLGVVDSGELPGSVDGYRIVTDSGAEYYGWSERS